MRKEQFIEDLSLAFSAEQKMLSSHSDPVAYYTQLTSFPQYQIHSLPSTSIDASYNDHWDLILSLFLLYVFPLHLNIHSVIPCVTLTDLLLLPLVAPRNLTSLTNQVRQERKARVSPYMSCRPADLVLVTYFH